MKFHQIVITCALIALCALPGQAQENNQPFKVVTTIGQITNIAKIIGGPQVRVNGLMGAGVDPHLYKASESDVRKLSEADIILYSGLFLEAKMEPIFKRMKRNKVTDAVSEVIPANYLLDSINYPGHHDPHVWFDVTLWSMVTERIRDVFSAYAPQHSELFAERTDKYLKELNNLNKYVEERASELQEEQRVLVTAHDAFRYFGRKYGFEVVGLQGMNTESEAGTADVIELAKFITKRKIKAIFIESSVPERNIKAVQEAVRARNWDVKVGGELFSDAMGNEGTFEGTYIGMVTHNIDTIVNGLKGKPSNDAKHNKR